MALPMLAGCQQSHTVSITFGGDVMLAREGEALFMANPWQNISLPESDFFFVNLESPLTAAPTTPKTAAGYDLCATDAQHAILQWGGVDLASIANNHQADCGTAAQTAEILAGQNIAAVDDTSPYYLQTSAGRFGIIAADLTLMPMDASSLMAMVGATRPLCDWLIVSLHWGVEYQAAPTAAQRELAQQLADAGVDVLWGHHPHVLQPMEWVAASGGQHRMLTIFSLGNLLSDQWMLADAQRTALVTVVFDQQNITAIHVQPLVMQHHSNSLAYPDASSLEKILTRLTVAELDGFVE